MIRITIICPEAHLGDANSLAMALGQGPADGLTFGAAAWQDRGGSRYAAASLPFSSAWLAAAQSPLARPAWDIEPYAVNMAGAGRAQARVVLQDPAGEAPLPRADSATILVLAGEPLAMLAAAGLVRIEAADADA